jgi:hypothetical protein
MTSYPKIGKYIGMDGNDPDYLIQVLAVDAVEDRIVILTYPFADRLIIDLDEWQYYWDEYFLERLPDLQS